MILFLSNSEMYFIVLYVWHCVWLTQYRLFLSLYSLTGFSFLHLLLLWRLFSDPLLISPSTSSAIFFRWSLLVLDVTYSIRLRPLLPSPVVFRSPLSSLSFTEALVLHHPCLRSHSLSFFVLIFRAPSSVVRLPPSLPPSPPLRSISLTSSQKLDITSTSTLIYFMRVSGPQIITTSRTACVTYDTWRRIFCACIPHLTLNKFQKVPL